MKIESRTENCASCVHFGYCMVYWGVDCKRQGGKRIPRMKPTPVVILEKAAKTRTKRMEVSAHKPKTLTSVGKQKLDNPITAYKSEMLKKILEIFEPIRTKVANW